MKKRGLMVLFLVFIVLLSSFVIGIMPEDEEDEDDIDDGEIADGAPLPVDFELGVCIDDIDCPENSYCEEEECIGEIDANCDLIIECEESLVCDPTSNLCARPYYTPCEDEGERSGCLETAVCSELEGFMDFWCVPVCELDARDGRGFSGCEGDTCLFNGDCAEELFCYERTCQEIPPDYCVENSDCGEFTCFDNYCVNPSCEGDRDCPEGLSCSENVCVAGMIACLNSRGCPENHVCSSRRCVRACSSDFNCGIYTLGEQVDLQVCNTQYLCENFCNEHITTNRVIGFGIDDARTRYGTAEIEQESPYLFGLGDATFDLREMEMIYGEDRYQIISVLGYRGIEIFFDKKFEIYMFANQLYILDDEGNYYVPEMVETDITGIYSTEPTEIEGGFDVAAVFSVERRELIVDVSGLTKTIDMDPLAIYNFNIGPGVFYWLIVNDCEMDFDCFEDSDCEEGQFCWTDTHTCHGIIVIEGPGAPPTGEAETTVTPSSGRNRGRPVSIITPSATCQNNEECESNEYCFEDECLEKTSIMQCQERPGLVCDSDESCLSGDEEVIGDVLCCLGENDECMSTEYNEDIESTTIISRSDCIDSDGDNMGVREISVCYAVAGECSSDSEHLVPASDLGLSTNPYFESCYIPTKEDLSTFVWVWYLVGGIVVAVGISVALIIPKKK